MDMAFDLHESRLGNSPLPILRGIKYACRLNTRFGDSSLHPGRCNDFGDRVSFHLNCASLPKLAVDESLAGTVGVLVVVGCLYGFQRVEKYDRIWQLELRADDASNLGYRYFSVTAMGGRSNDNPLVTHEESATQVSDTADVFKFTLSTIAGTTLKEMIVQQRESTQP